MNPFSVVRSDALLDSRLQKSPATYMTLCAISTFTTRNKDGYCYFKQETVASKLGKSRQAVSRDLKSLAEWGYIEIIPQNYRGFKSNNAYRLKYEGNLNDATTRCDDATTRCTTTQHDVATKCSSINAEKEKKALTRNEFLREVDAGYKSSEFDEFEHLTETEIIAEAKACFDFYASKDEWPAGAPVYVLRSWLRYGIKAGKIRKAAASKSSQQGGEETKPGNPLQHWHTRAENRFDEATFRAWIRPLYWDGEHLCAPTAFFRDYVTNKYVDQLKGVIDAEIIHKPYQPKESEKEHEKSK